LIEKWGGATEEEARELRRASQRRCAQRYRNRPENAEKVRAQIKNWYLKNRALSVARASHATAMRRVAKAKEKDPSLPGQPLLSAEQKAACIAIRLEAYTRSEITGEPHVVDHVIEIADGGLEVPGNLQILTWSEHNKKSLAHRIEVRAAYRAARKAQGPAS
jgi:5-methylcytosine-specific restriction endonuclease McrA